jgi:hypothetical protein
MTGRIARLWFKRAPAFNAQQLGDHAVAVSAVFLGKPDERQPQSVVVLRDGPILHGTAGEPDHLAGPALRICELLAGIDDSLTQLARRQALAFK